MKLGIVGLGRMGRNMALRLARGGHEVVVYNRTVAKADALAGDHPGIEAAASLRQLVEALAEPPVVWIMVPAGAATQSVLDEVSGLLQPGAILVEGGNSHYADTLRRGRASAERGLTLVDVGVSGGVWGLEAGYSLMAGGDAAAIERLGPILETLAPAPDRGWGRVGPSGAGHYVKMVHNGIEYGMMQALAEGFQLLSAKEELQLDLARVAEIWRFGSVVRSWLLDLVAARLAEGADLAGIEPYVDDSGEGRWTAIEAVELGVPAPVISLALQMRFASRGRADYAARLLAAMRHAFGGHAVRPASPDGP